MCGHKFILSLQETSYEVNLQNVCHSIVVARIFDGHLVAQPVLPTRLNNNRVFISDHICHTAIKFAVSVDEE